ncbi:membrane protein [Candidatus Magnetomorum sp. HK-1]|nr:membrane protein [Candidatus Magnetomorum sp. HK-1]
MHFLACFITICYYLIKRSLWLQLAGPHEASMSYHYHTFKFNILNYFKFFMVPLSLFFMSITYGKSRKLGNVIYDLMLSSTGLFFYFVTFNLTQTKYIAILSLLIFYFCSLTPHTFSIDAEPEVYSNFFSALGLLIVSYSITFNNIPGIIIGTFISSLGFWTKILTPESLWNLAYIFIIKGVGLEFVLCLSTLITSIIIFAFLVYYANKNSANNNSANNKENTYKDNDLCLLVTNFISCQIEDRKRSYSNYSLSAAVNWHYKYLYPYLLIIFFNIFFFISFFILDFDINLKKIILSWFIISLVHGLVRLQFHPLHFVMAQYPASIGSASLLCYLSTVFINNYLISILLFIFWVILVVPQYYNTTNRIERKKEDNLVKKNIVDILSNQIQKDDYIFQDYYNTTYYHLGCKGPPPEFFYAHSIKWMFEKKESRKKFINFFKKNKPKYYIVRTGLMDLSYIEKISGLKYELIRMGRCNIYKLENIDKNITVEDFDPDKLYFKNVNRYNDDRKKLEEKINKFSSIAIQSLNDNPKESLRLINNVQTMHENVMLNIHYFKAFAFFRLNMFDEATHELEKELSNQPDHKKSHELLKIINQSKNENKKTEDDNIQNISKNAIQNSKNNLKKEVSEYENTHENIQLLMDKGEKCFASGDLEEAEKIFQKVVTIAPDHCIAYNNLGVIYWKKENFVKAIEHFKKALTIDPDNKNSVVNCVKLLKHINKLEDAKAILLPFLNKYPEDNDILSLLSDIQ